jgi:hypothetical protein
MATAWSRALREESEKSIGTSTFRISILGDPAVLDR